MEVFQKEYALAYDHIYHDKDYERECDFIEAAFKKHSKGVKTILDLGCGTGNFVAFLEKKGSCDWQQLVGLDLSEKAVNEGKARGLESDITKLVAADVLNLKQNRTQLVPMPDVISLMFVLHEFDDKMALQIIDSCHCLWPTSKILLTEMIHLDDSQIKKSNGTVVPELNFVHRLSYQVIRSKAEWERLFAVAGYRLVTSREHSLTYTFCLLFSQK